MNLRRCFMYYACDVLNASNRSAAVFNHVLREYGEGSMGYYKDDSTSSGSTAPWLQHRQNIIHIIIPMVVKREETTCFMQCMNAEAFLMRIMNIQ